MGRVFRHSFKISVKSSCRFPTRKDKPCRNPSFRDVSHSTRFQTLPLALGLAPIFPWTVLSSTHTPALSLFVIRLQTSALSTLSAANVWICRLGEGTVLVFCPEHIQEVSQPSRQPQLYLDFCHLMGSPINQGTVTAVAFRE